MKAIVLRFALLSVVCGHVVAAGVTKPNIVYLLADDLGYGDVRCLNPDGKIPTPHLDRLAAAGMVFTDATVGSVLDALDRLSLAKDTLVIGHKGVGS